MCRPHCGGDLRPLRFHAASPLGQRDLLVAVCITVARHLLAAFAQMAGTSDQVPEDLPLLALPELALVLVQKHKTQCGNALVL